MLDYTAGTNKGGVTQGTKFNGVFGLGSMTDNRVNYTSQSVVESFTTVTSGTTKVAWTPVIADSATAYDANGNILKGTGDVPGVTIASDGTITVATGVTAANIAKIAYKYNNEYIPQNDLPILNATLKTVALTAHARRIAIYYSQIASFQA